MSKLSKNIWSLILTFVYSNQQTINTLENNVLRLMKWSRNIYPTVFY